MAVNPLKTGWLLYLIQCRDGSLYTGVTKDLARRLREHDRGKGGRYTRGRGPVTLVYLERHRNRSSAQRREAEIKRWSRAKKFELKRTPVAGKHVRARLRPRAVKKHF